MTRRSQFARARPTGRAAAAAVRLLLVVALATGVAQGQGPAGDAGAYPTDSLEPWIQDEATADRLRTPNDALVTFLDAGDAGDFETAARALNLADVPPEDRREQGPELARKLHLVMGQRVDIDWRTIPDRPDGANDLPQLFSPDDGEGTGTGPAPRRNLLVGLVDLADREAEVRLERVQPPNLPPLWLIARSTVDDIDGLYEEHGPGWLEGVMPEWAQTDVGAAPVWQWLAFLVLVAASVGLGVLLQRLTAYFMASSERRWMRGLAGEVARPLALLASLVVLWLATSWLLTLTGPLSRWVARVLVVLLIVAITWLGTSVINFFSEYVGKHHVDRLIEQDERRARRHLTYLSVARRLFVFLVVVVGLAVVLAQFDAFRTLGASLLASAGVAGIVLGIAAQGTLANVMAGVQIALTQLIQIGDNVFFDGEWSYVEDITYTYVVLRTWDQRRIAVPNKHVIANPLENWEMTNSHMTMSTVLYVDYRTPLDELRRHYEEILQAAEDWDGEAQPSLKAIGVEVDVLKIRVLCSAKDASTAWLLHAYLREELVAFLRDWEGGRYLPRQRTSIEGDTLTVRER